ncbi:MAG: hypothetical protein HYY14_07215 [Candidatus Omnitrophica bacterium]|nr:hypothetical protein [Candidatus Omnitrophota bacterium]
MRLGMAGLMFGISLLGCAVSPIAGPERSISKDNFLISQLAPAERYEELGPVGVEAASGLFPVSDSTLHKRLRKEALKLYGRVDGVIRVTYSHKTFAPGLLDWEQGRRVEGIAVRFLEGTVSMESERVTSKDTSNAVTFTGTAWAGKPDPEDAPYFGFTPFPYDFTLEAVTRTREIIVPHSTLYALHFDDGVPWDDLLADRVISGKAGEKWDDEVRRIPKGHVVYVGLAPLATDRKSLVGGLDGTPLPKELQGAGLDNPTVKEAYLRYARQAVEKFHPKFLNVGIEAGELARNDPTRWPQFEALFDYVYSRLKEEYPDLWIGISFGLGSLRRPDVAERVKPLVEKCDYLGLSFYPYTSSFGEAMGDPPLPAAPGAWREPFEWLRGYTRKPVAICETGYTTRDISIPTYGLKMYGDEKTQADYVRDLGRFARRDGWLFVTWFLAVDYDALFEKMSGVPGSEANLIWRNIGFFDSSLRPKLGWEEWRAVLAGGPKDDVDSGARHEPAPLVPQTRQDRPGSFQLDFSKAADVFTVSPGTSVTAVSEGPAVGTTSMQWNYHYQGQWIWAVKPLPSDRLRDARTLGFWARSDRDGQVFVQVEESGGEAFFVMVPVGAEWKRFEYPLNDLSVDEKKRQDGRLDASRISNILLADEAGVKGAAGSRTIWIADVVFE